MGKPHSALAASAVAEQVSMVLSLKGSQELHSAPFSHQPWCQALPPQEDWWFTTTLSRLGAELELRRSGSSLGPSQ